VAFGVNMVLNVLSSIIFHEHHESEANPSTGRCDRGRRCVEVSAMPSCIPVIVIVVQINLETRQFLNRCEKKSLAFSG
jgi:hypothetical protein